MKKPERRGRPKNPDNEGGRWAVYLSKRHRDIIEPIALRNRRTVRAEIELAIEAHAKRENK